MSVTNTQPSVKEMKAILKQATRCLECDAPECHEFTPGGVEVCSELQWWNGKPLPKPELLKWAAMLAAKKPASN